MPVMAEISVAPIGAVTPGVGVIIAAAFRVLERYPQVQRERSAMGTTLVGELPDVVAACG